MEHSSQSSAERAESQKQTLHQDEEGISFLRTCFNGLNALSGVGILSVPYALSEGGWLCLMILLLVAISCCYTGLLLQRCMDSSPGINTYPDIAGLAFGKKGRLMISMFMYLELYLVAVEFLILEGDNLQKLFPDANFHLGSLKLAPKQAFVLLVTLLILPTTWLRSLGLLAYVSAGGVLASLVLVCCIFWIGVVDGVGFHENGYLWGSLGGFLRAISLFSFCYCGHAVFPSLCNSMKDRTQFPKVLILCFVASTLSYGSMAILGNLMYGRHLQSQVTLNLPNNKTTSKIAIYTTLANPITKYAIVVAPIATAIEDAIPLRRRSKPVIMLTTRTSLVISTVVVALTVPLFGQVMTFVGAFLSVAMSFLFPCACYLKINAGCRRFGIEGSVIVVILILGSFVGN